MAQACGLTDRVPTYRTFGRRFKAWEQPAIQAALQLIRRLTKRRWIRSAILVTDASLLAANGRVPKEGRHSQPPTDPEAAWGCRAGDGKRVWGYKLHAFSTVRPCLVPMAWVLTTANVNESKYLSVVLHRVPKFRHKRPWCLGDTEYNSRQNV